MEPILPRRLNERNLTKREVVKIKRKFSLLLLVSILAVAAVTINVVSDMETQQTEQDFSFDQSDKDFQQIGRQDLLALCDGISCDYG